MAVHVHLLTWCHDLANLYGTVLVFKTLRVGFPSAQVHIVDNASLGTARPVLRRHAESCGADYTQLEQAIAHHDFIEQTIERQAEGTAVFVDPDVCFWERVEEWSFDALMAGRLLPNHACEYTGCITHRRLHTSLLWVPEVSTLREAIGALRRQYFEFQPFQPSMLKLGNAWHRFDTGASLFAAASNRMRAFTSDELGAYDHLFCGTHLGAVAPRIRPDYALLFERLHTAVQQDYRLLKGAWKLQETYFDDLTI